MFNAVFLSSHKPLYNTPILSTSLQTLFLALALNIGIGHNREVRNHPIWIHMTVQNLPYFTLVLQVWDLPKINWHVVKLRFLGVSGPGAVACLAWWVIQACTRKYLYLCPGSAREHFLRKKAGICTTRALTLEETHLIWLPQTAEELY